MVGFGVELDVEEYLVKNAHLIYRKAQGCATIKETLSGDLLVQVGLHQVSVSFVNYHSAEATI